MFYDIYRALCDTKGISCKRAAIDIGLSNSVTVKWKNGATPSGSTLSKIADYFEVSTDYLLGTEKSPIQKDGRQIGDDDLKFALFGGEGEITDAMFEEVKRFAQMVKLREEAEKKE